MSDVKFFICPMSKNIVDAVLELDRKDIGLLPSRRQIDYDGGYIGWNTKQFSQYVGNNVIVQRDHGGAGQGKVLDDGKASYKEDSLYFNLIHIDPWKTCVNKHQGLEKTIEDILYLYTLNPDCKFEVGTEQTIFQLSSEDLFWFLNELKTRLPENVFQKIEYVVIQSGVGLDVLQEANVGKFSIKKLQEEIAICKYFGKKSKEHNGDFLTKEQKYIRFKNGLTSINIGPELSIFENTQYLSHMTSDQLHYVDGVCKNSGFWKKWVTTNDKLSMPGIYFRICGHYNYNQLTLPEIDVVSKLKSKILTIVE